MLPKNMLAKTREDHLPQNKKKPENEKTIVTTWNLTLKYLSQILRKNINILKTESALKNYSQRIAFRKKNSIRNCIVRTDRNKANEQKKPKITTSSSSCRKTCDLINSNETLKNIHNWKEIKKSDRVNRRTANIVYAWWCLYRQHWIETEKDSTNAGTMSKADQMTMNWQPTYTNTITTLTRILTFWY